VCNEEQVRIPAGSEFHTEGTATLKPREAKVAWTQGPTTDWCKKSVENVPEYGSQKKSGGK